MLPTDTMKNTVYALASQEPSASRRRSASASRGTFSSATPRLTRVRIDLTEHAWGRMAIGGREHGQAFIRSGPDVRTATVQADRDGQVLIGAGVADLVILKTSHSAFVGIPAR